MAEFPSSVALSSLKLYVAYVLTACPAAHSLGTALATDILSRQPTWVKDMSELPPDEQRSDKQLL